MPIVQTKVRVFAFELTSNEPVLGQASSITAKWSKDYSVPIALTDTNPTEAEDGFYYFDLTESERDVSIIGDGEKIVAQVIDKKSDSSNQYTVDLETETTEKFTVYFRLENFKMISDNYTVGISSNNIAKFVGENYKVTYYIACEADSKFD
jgi:hypothetical protein